PDLTGLGCCRDSVDRLVDLVGCDRHFDLDFRQEAHRVFGAAINFRVALLTPVALDLGHGHPVHTDPDQSVADLVELERLDDGHDDFDGFNPRLGPPCGCRVMGSLACAFPRETSFSPGNAAATNQAPCQFAPPAVSTWKQEALAGGRVLPASFCQAPHKS